MSEEQRHPVYAAVHKDRFQAVCAARALFAEVYDLLLKRGLTVELRPFANEQFEVPQIHTLEGVELHDGGYRPVISFNVETVHRSFAGYPIYRLEVKFEPPYGMKNVRGFEHMVTVSRNSSRTPNRMDPKSICEFVLKYADGVRKRQAVIDTQRAESVLKQARVRANEDIAKQLRERPSKGRAYVFACQDNPKHGENEVWLQLRGTPEEIAAACALLDPAFPLPQTGTSRE